MFHKMLQNLKVVLVAVAIFGLIATSWVLSDSYYIVERFDHGTAQFAGVWGTLALFHFLYKVSRKSYGCNRFQLGPHG